MDGINVRLYKVEPPVVLAYEHIPPPFIPNNSATTNSNVSAAVIAAIDSPNSTANDFIYVKVSNSSTPTTSTLVSLSNSTYSYFISAVSHAVLTPTPPTTTLSMASFDLHPVLIEQDISSPFNGGNKLSEDVLGNILGPSTETTEGVGNDKLNSFYFYEMEQFAVLWILFTVIVLGNSAVLFVLFVNKNRKSRMNYFIKQLALAGRRAKHLVTAAWMVSVLFSLPILFLYEEKLIQGQLQCWIELGSPEAWQTYMCLVATTLFIVPALIISACYAIIVKTIWAKGSIFISAERCNNNVATRRASSRGIIPRAKVKTVKMTFVIVIVFILCWSPYIIFDLLQVFGRIPKTQTNIAIATFIQSLAPLNSAANPLIYCVFSSQVFRTLSRFPPFKWFKCCCRSYLNNSTQSRCSSVSRRLHYSCDSVRTLTTSLAVSRRSNKASAHVVICEKEKEPLAVSEV
ncbi:cardioacceleratory peptide receptor isoform X3 [Bactrocera oleae]|uniref:cardioacceleratory peptide receptor isoform X3 n=1 Tax=Bactrocera oleae TaxID=104688 RepID=UPI00387EDD31